MAVMISAGVRTSAEAGQRIVSHMPRTTPSKSAVITTSSKRRKVVIANNEGDRTFPPQNYKEREGQKGKHAAIFGVKIAR